MDALIERHAQIMDEFDAERRVGLIVDEWGTWYDPLPGTNPGFLEQDSTLRDALVAAVNLNLFAHHAARVRMANLAQTINVLQCLIRTDGSNLLLTPTYHAFALYQGHQGATAIPVTLETPRYELGRASLPALHASASRDEAGSLRLSLVNLDPKRAATVQVSGLGANVKGRLLTAPRMNDRNQFGRAPAVQPVDFDGITSVASKLELRLPEKSLVVLESR
jgi:alpha-N-arabinofuranosidase